MSRHTAEPWGVFHYNALNKVIIALLGKEPCIIGYTFNDRKSSEAETRANAYLMAAAPACFKACEIVLENLEAIEPVLDFKHEFDLLAFKACLDAVKAAIAKVEEQNFFESEK